MVTEGSTFEQWLKDAKVPRHALSPQQLAVLQAAFGFLQRCGYDYYSLRMLSHFLLNCDVGLKVEQVARRLRRRELRARTVTVKLRTGDFTTLTRSRTLDEATDGTETIWQAADGLFGHWSSQHFRPLRLIGVTASQLTSQAGQLSLFTSDADERQQRIDLAMDAIVERFGPQAARRGGVG